MSITVVVGAQFGGEGKGKMTAHLCRVHGYDVAVRCGGPNSGHTVSVDDQQVVLRQVPSGVVSDRTRLLLSAGCIIDLEVLRSEICRFGLTPSRLGIDPHAVIVEKAYAEEEESGGLGGRIGSTCTGTGIAVARRILRTQDVRLVKDVAELAPYLSDVSAEVNSSHQNGQKIVIEGTQGFGLSVYHSPYYPFATSRDTTASGFLSEVGVSPLAVSQVVMVVRTFPIRVGGNSGPLPNEIDWQTIQRDSGYPYRIQEYTSVTSKLRRVARFDIELVTRAAAVNMPSRIALMGVDYLDYENKGVKRWNKLAEQTRHLILWTESELKASIDFIGTGPSNADLIDNLEELENGCKRDTATRPMWASLP